jgi:hypothetical protein
MNPAASAFPVALLRGKRANGKRCHSLRIEDSPQFTAKSFNSSDARNALQEAYTSLRNEPVLQFPAIMNSYYSLS